MLLPFQGANALGGRVSQGAAPLALGYALLGFQPVADSPNAPLGVVPPLCLSFRKGEAFSAKPPFPAPETLSPFPVKSIMPAYTVERFPLSRVAACFSLLSMLPRRFLLTKKQTSPNKLVGGGVKNVNSPPRPLLRVCGKCLHRRRLPLRTVPQVFATSPQRGAGSLEKKKRLHRLKLHT